MTWPDYQYGYSENPVAGVSLYDEEGRQKKGRKIVPVLQDYLGSMKGLSLLDMSCSTGMMTQVCSPVFAELCCIDIDRKAVEFARQNNGVEDTEFHVMDALRTDMCAGNTLEQRLALLALRVAYAFVPGYVWLLRKPAGSRKRW